MQAAPDPFAADRQLVKDMQTEATKADVDYNAAVAKAKVVFHRKPEYLAAQKAVDDTTTEKDKARRAVITKLKPQPDYKAATDKVTAAQAKLDKLKANGAARSEISEASSEVLKLSAAPSVIETEALKKDASYTQASDKLAAAVAALKALEDQFTATVNDDETIKPLVDAKKAAHSKLDDAKAKLDQDEHPGKTPAATPATPATPASQPAGG